MRGPTDSPSVSLSAASTQSSSTLLENLKNLLAGVSRAKTSQISAPNHQSLQQQRNALKDHLALSLEDIAQANAFDEIERISILLLQHSTSSLERATLKDLVSRLANLKEIVPATKSSIENVRAQKTSLSGKKADVRARLDQAREHCGSLEIEFSKISEEETELEAQILHLATRKKDLLIRKNSVALELLNFSNEVTKDVEEWKVIGEKTEEGNNKWLQVRETLAQPAQANLSWKLFKQNLEEC